MDFPQPKEGKEVSKTTKTKKTQRIIINQITNAKKRRYKLSSEIPKKPISHLIPSHLPQTHDQSKP